MGNNIINYKILNIIDRIKSYREKRQYVFIQVMLHYDIIKDFLNDFIIKQMSNDDELDIVKEIIISAKDLYELDYYTEPFEDSFYDKVIAKYLEFRKEPYSDNVYSGLTETPYKYDKLAGTLDKVHFIYNNERGEYETRESLEDYFNDLDIDKNVNLDVLVNEKKDGTSVTIDFKLVSDTYVVNLATTRGDRNNDLGADVTRVFDHITIKPSNIFKQSFKYLPEFIGVQFEFLVSNLQKAKFEKYINKTFANNRSAASGLLRRLIFANNNDLYDLRKFISLVPVGYDILDEYRVYYNDYIDEYFAVLSNFNIGDIDMETTIISGNTHDILNKFNNIYHKFENSRNSLNHAIDGLVLTILNDDIRENLGRKNSKNKFQIAYKFKEEGHKTKVRDLLISYGNFGYVGLLLKVDPVTLNGTVQEKAQIHSIDKFNKMNIHIGDEIILKLSNDVIPFGYITNECKRGNGKKLELPIMCDCGSEFIEENNMLRCPNEKCSHRIVGFLNTFLNEMGAKGIGDKLCEKLYKQLNIDTPIKLLSLNKYDFMQLNGVKNKSATKYEEIINKIITEPKSPESILSSLCIDSFRKNTAKKVMDVIDIHDLSDLINSGNVDKLITLLNSCEGIDENSYKIAKGLITKKDMLTELIKIIQIKNKNIYYNTDKVLVVSGFRDDDEFIEMANKNGYEVKNSSKKMDLLVIANDSMMNKSKARFAIANNIPILTKTQFVNKYK